MTIQTRTCLAMFALAIALLVACSSDDAPTTPTGGDQNTVLTGYANALARIAPPVYTGPVGFPAANDSFWFEGQYPAIGKAFGNQETQSLYKNIDHLDQAVGMAEIALAVGNCTDSMVSNGVDSAVVTIQIEDLQDPIAIPAGCEGVLGSTPLALEKFCRVTFQDNPDSTYMAFTANDSVQTFLIWEYWPASEQWNCGPTTLVFYAHQDLRTDSVDFRGALYRETGNYHFRTIWQITTIDGDNFDYNMIFHGTGESAPEPGIYNGLSGGGDKDSSFVLRAVGFEYPGFAIDQETAIASQFGPNYSYIGDVIPEHLATFVADDHFFSPTLLPSAYIPNPFGQ